MNEWGSEFAESSGPQGGVAGAEASTSPGDAVLDMQVHGPALVPLNQKLCVSTALQGMLT